MSGRNSELVGSLVAALLAEQNNAEPGAELLRFAQLGRDPRAGPGACSARERQRRGACWPLQAIGKRLCGRIAGTSVAPEFVPKRNSELVGAPGLRPEDAVRRGIGDGRVPNQIRR